MVMNWCLRSHRKLLTGKYTSDNDPNPFNKQIIILSLRIRQLIHEKQTAASVKLCKMWHDLQASIHKIIYCKQQACD